jgi:hypothetical protein
MIDQADEQVVAWARATVPDAAVKIAPPPADGAEAGVRIHLLSVQPVAAMRGMKRAPLELALRYLVTTSSAHETDAHRWLGALMFGALDVAEWQVERNPTPIELWRAFGVAPRPAFIVSVPVRLERPEKEVPLVRRPPVVRTTPVGELAGVIVGPEDVPIAGATIEIPSLQLNTQTNHDGAFRFPTVPATSAVSLVVRAKRLIRTVRARPGEALRISFDDLEG